MEKMVPEFESKMFQVLCVYKENGVLLTSGNLGKTEIIQISYDEKPGIQAMGNTDVALRSEPYRQKVVGRYFEYVRHCTQSMLTGIELLTDENTVTVSDIHII